MAIRAGCVRRLGFAFGMVAVAQVSVAQAQAVVGSVSAGPAFIEATSNRVGVVFGGSVEKRSGLLTLGGDVTFLHVPERETTFANASGVVVGGARNPEVNVTFVSFKASYYPLRFASSRLHPFVDGGLSVLLPAAEPGGTLDVGGGFDWWKGRHTGVRLDVRGQLPIGILVRCGLIFR